jgi:hypothetical protein
LIAKKALKGTTVRSAAATAEPASQSASGARAHERVRRLHAVPSGERRQDGSVRGVEVACARREHEGRDDERPERQRRHQPRERDRHERGGPDEVGGHHHPLALGAVGEDAAVEAEDERRQAVGEPHDQDAQRPACEQCRPHQCDVLERVADLARPDREVDAPEAWAAQQREGAGCRRRHGMRQRLLRRCGYRIRQGADLAAPTREAAPAWPARPSDQRSPRLEVGQLPTAMGKDVPFLKWPASKTS